jgi:hypothetical protein
MSVKVTIKKLEHVQLWEEGSTKQNGEVWVVPHPRRSEN